MDFRDWFMKRNLVGSVSYVTGSHAFKTGIQYGWGWIDSWRDANGSMVQRYRNGRARLDNAVERADAVRIGS